jgi:acyl dehydratase
MARYLEDFHPGAVEQLGSVTVTEAEIVDFGRRFDPQPFHVDPEAARRSPYGGLIASGWHTCGLMMRLLVEHFLSPEASLGSPGVDELRWLAPVRPGDVLSVRVTVQEATRSRSKPDRGALRTLTEVLNQAGKVVMTVQGVTIVRCRDGAA